MGMDSAIEPAFLTLHLRRQSLEVDQGGHTCWRVVETEKQLLARKIALIICDMWDRHWSRGAAKRVDEMAPRIDRVVRAARDAGMTIIHAPSNTLEFYAASPARQRMLDIPQIQAPPNTDHDDPPLPIDDTDDGSDTGESIPQRVWTRQHSAIWIDEEKDYISDDGLRILSLLRQLALEQVLIMGVHTNMCILNRSFGIKQMVRWGEPAALVRDLTDAMYNPARRPYVSHAAGTQLVIEYIEKFWCPTLNSIGMMGR
jgi:nicotinamidase-related amidase